MGQTGGRRIAEGEERKRTGDLHEYKRRSSLHSHRRAGGRPRSAGLKQVASGDVRSVVA